MLRYLNFGERAYGERPLAPHRRANWEFQAVVAGRCVPTDEAGHALGPPVGRRLWVTPPGHLHGWVGVPGRPCRIVVGHFERVPEALPSLREKAPIERPLTPAEARQVEALMLALLPDFRRPTNLSPLRFERAALELTLLALQSVIVEQPTDFAGEKVAQALAWYSEQMERRPSMAEVAQAVYLSASQLRRLFRQHGAGTPLREMKRLQLDRAMLLVRHTDETFGRIAHTCGFGSASDFSRVFHRHSGHSPAAERRATQGAAAAGSRTVSGK